MIPRRDGRGGYRLWDRALLAFLSVALVGVVAWLAERGLYDGFTAASGDRSGALSQVWVFAPKRGADLVSEVAHAVLADLDADGRPEVVAALQFGRVFALAGATGKPLWASTVSGNLEFAPVAWDVAGDRRPEVVVATDQKIVVLDGRTGSALWSSHPGCGAAVADLRSDGHPAVVVARRVSEKAGVVCALDGRTGETIWSVTVPSPVLAPPGVGDLDQDGNPDVVIASEDQSVVALSGLNGRVLWRFHTTGPLLLGPSVGDLDGDGVADVVIGGWRHAVYAIAGPTGHLLWSLDRPDSRSTRAAIVDLNGDKHPEAVPSLSDGYVEMVSGDKGRVLWSARAAPGYCSRAAVADLDGDGRQEFVFGQGFKDGRIVILDASSGSLVAISGEAHNATVSEPPAIGDLEGDGDPEIVVGCESGHVHALTFHQ